MVFTNHVFSSWAELQAWTSLSFSTQSGRHAVGDRSRMVSPSVGSIQLTTSVNHVTIASSVAEGNEKPTTIEEALEATPPPAATKIKGRKVGVRKSLHTSVASVEVPKILNLGAKFEDDEQGTTNSDPGLNDEGQPTDDIVESPIKKKKKDSTKKKATAIRVTQGRQNRFAANQKSLR